MQAGKNLPVEKTERLSDCDHLLFDQSEGKDNRTIAGTAARKGE